ncbi:hypothetical protein [Agarilytica rhodophyticola]|uniref:hypothetical protein n=1 Tax=Agarilytica rhodophyticola TaxID=1737490 RepID=UPI001315423F|nr:hypothetical protein [Agarilytica rhodophyticola]
MKMLMYLLCGGIFLSFFLLITSDFLSYESIDLKETDIAIGTDNDFHQRVES